jgi:S-adenosylmethionine decarboxylase
MAYLDKLFQQAYSMTKASDVADHFIYDPLTYERYAGKHIIIDIYNADSDKLKDLDFIRSTIKQCVIVAKATFLCDLFHPFDGGGVTGVAILAESHISVHTWPEENFAAFDVFMCGSSVPLACVPILQEAFGGTARVQELRRGLLTAKQSACMR